jgi:hypothetical protein
MPSQDKDLFSYYMDFVDLDNQEAPAIYHRWTLASIIGTILGRQFYLPFGKGIIYPNQFIMLMGTPGTRKGSAMNIGRDLLKAAGYSRFSASRTSLERFLIDMKHWDDTVDVLELEELAFDGPSESYIFAGEFVDFIGPNDISFINLLTNLWDNPPDYKHPKIQGKSVEVHKPTVNLFGGSTPQTFAIAFPPEVIGTGFTSRLLLIHAEPTGKKIAWPSITDALISEALIMHLKDIRENIKGEAIFTHGARRLADKIYGNEVPVDDSRFTFYQQRRHTHLLKLALIHAAADLTREVSEEHLLRANTMLSRAERWMPKALGEFGKSRYAAASNEILQFLGRRTKPATVADIWKVVDRVLTKLPELTEVLSNLKSADKIQTITMVGKTGYMPKHTEKPEWKNEFILSDWLTEEEKI